MRSPLRSARVQRIIAAYTINRLGTWFGFVALSVAVYDHTHSALAVGALLLCSQVIPAFLVPALVARVEASRRRSELSALYLFEAGMSALLVVLLATDFLLGAVLVLVALDGTAALAASALLRTATARSAREWAQEREQEQPAAESEVPVAESDVPAAEADDGRVPGAAEASLALDAERRANAALNVGFALTFTLGPALAGLTIPAFGVSAAILIDMTSFLICAVMMLDVRAHVEDAEEASVRERLRAAWQHIVGSITLRRLLLIQAVALVFFEFSPPIEVAYAKTSLHAGDSGYGYLLGVWGLGVAVGSIVFARSIHRSLSVLLSSSTLAVGVAYLGWAVAPTLALACGAGFVGGIGNGVQWAALISAVQRITPASLHGRLMGAVESIGAISPGVGFVLGSGIVALSSPRAAFLVAGIGAGATALPFARLPIGARRPEDAGPATDAAAVSHAPTAAQPAQPLDAAPRPQ